MPAVLIFLFLLFSCNDSFSQIRPPEKRSFNVGFYTGLGGLNFIPLPTLDLNYKRNHLRLAPGVAYAGIGYSREVIRLSEVFYSWYGLLSLYYAKGTTDGPGIRQVNTQIERLMGLTGLRIYFSDHFFSQFQLGIMYSELTTPGYPFKKETTPYFEFGIGYNFFKAFLPKRSE